MSKPSSEELMSAFRKGGTNGKPREETLALAKIALDITLAADPDADRSVDEDGALSIEARTRENVEVMTELSTGGNLTGRAYNVKTGYCLDFRSAMTAEDLKDLMESGRVDRYEYKGGTPQPLPEAQRDN